MPNFSALVIPRRACAARVTVLGLSVSWGAIFSVKGGKGGGGGGVPNGSNLPLVRMRVIQRFQSSKFWRSTVAAESVSLSLLQLASRTFIRPKNDTTYLAGHVDGHVRTNLSENSPLSDN